MERTLDGFRITHPPVSTYDRRRLLDPEAKAEPIGSVKEITFEHQQAAIEAGYQGILYMLVDEMAAAIRDLQERVTELEQEREPQAGEIEP